MVQLNEVVDVSDVERLIGEGYIKRQVHPGVPYSILNYTDKCQYDAVWTHETKNCRGLIYNHDTNEVVARGMPKFFNYGQPQAPQFDLNDEVYVADKADGSLGIIYQLPSGQYAVATRGSFTSEQAIHATGKLPKGLGYEHGYTWLVEIVYPDNRIVVDYGDLDELVGLGVVDNLTGRFKPEDVTFGTMTYAEALAMPPRPNAEGLVLTRISDGAMVKVKQADYLALHRIIFGLSERALWQLVIDGADVDSYIESLPDEFIPWAKTVLARMEAEVVDIQADCSSKFEYLMDDLDELFGRDCWGRGEFAARAKDYDESWALFALLDGKDIEPIVWKRIKPEGNRTPVRAHGEDVA